MTRFLSASKTARSVLSRLYESQNVKLPGGLTGRCCGYAAQSAQVRFLSGKVGAYKPLINKLFDKDKEFCSSFDRSPNAVQCRGLFGVGFEEEGSPLSKTYKERRVIGYSPEQVFAVVAAVDLYEDFLPWCQRSQITRHNDAGSFNAELKIGFKFFVESYTSHVEIKKPDLIKSTVSDSGLFDHLTNIWEFNPGPIHGTCDLYFYVDFKFQSPLYRQVASMFFKEVVARLVGSFNDRCRLIYGPGTHVLENSYTSQRA
ncbi:hypothetical protein H6P81_004989 [Aristolochia fimbriata]|uniref:Coenzyme Q-binding protein COQ10 START domain-containing protein n=1 Tax=Aristolochia fimbriata TaxID=158543 RepID=A0AAV7ET75_ARIFI|nr:hypothetical protein H6P81_004989 [Aristolochia fimbriata]